MTDHEVTFTRYSKTRATRELSAPMFIRATNFADAHDRAQMIIRAMGEIVTPDEWDYAVEMIRTVGYSGTRFKGFTSIWMNAPSDNK